MDRLSNEYKIKAGRIRSAFYALSTQVGYMVIVRSLLGVAVEFDQLEVLLRSRIVHRR